MSVFLFDFASLYPTMSSFNLGKDYEKSSKYILDRNKEYNNIEPVLLIKYGLIHSDLFDFYIIKNKIREYNLNKILKSI